MNNPNINPNNDKVTTPIKEVINQTSDNVDKINDNLKQTVSSATKESSSKSNSLISTIAVIVLSILVLALLAFSLTGYNPFQGLGGKKDAATSTSTKAEVKKEEITSEKAALMASAETAKKAIVEIYKSASCTSYDIAVNGPVSCTLEYKSEPNANQIANSLVLIAPQGGNMYSPSLAMQCKVTTEKTKLLCDAPTSTLTAGTYMVISKLQDQYTPNITPVLVVK
jgi:hypothetical protein